MLNVFQDQILSILNILSALWRGFLENSTGSKDLQIIWYFPHFCLVQFSQNYLQALLKSQIKADTLYFSYKYAHLLLMTYVFHLKICC